MAPDLSARETMTATPLPDEGIHLARLRLGPHDNFVYLVGDPETRKAVCIDPAFDVPRILDVLDDWGHTLAHILHTHNHWDHVEGSQDLAAKTGAPVHIHEADAPALEQNGHEVTRLHGGERFDLGTRSVYVHHTPGHTAGGITYQAGKRLFTGDFLFNETAGRCDFPSGSKERMWSSLQWLKKTFPDDAIIHPGHDYGKEPTVTLGWAKEHNPALSHIDYAAFEQEWFLEAY